MKNLALSFILAIAASGQQAPEPPDSTAANQPVVTAFFQDAPIAEVVVEIANESGVQIIADTSLPDARVTIDFKETPVEIAIEQVAMTVGAYWKEARPGRFLLSMATPQAPLFWEFARLERYMPTNVTARTLESVVPPAHKPYVEFDVENNVISVTAPGRLADRILADLRALDRPLRQIVVELTVAEITTTKGHDLGFSWNWGDFQFTSGLEALYSTATRDDFARLRLMVEDGRAKLRASPRFVAREGEQAELTVGQEAWVSILAGNVNFPTSQIQRIKTGVTLRFTALVGDDGLLTVRLEPEVSDALTELQDTIVTNVRSAKTTLTIRSGTTVAIGGLTMDRSQKTRQRVPILSDIPLIGGLFSKSTDSTETTEVVILVTPRLVESGEASPIPLPAQPGQ